MLLFVVALNTARAVGIKAQGGVYDGHCLFIPLQKVVCLGKKSIELSDMVCVAVAIMLNGLWQFLCLELSFHISVDLHNSAQFAQPLTVQHNHHTIALASLAEAFPLLHKRKGVSRTSLCGVAAWIQSNTDKPVGLRKEQLGLPEVVLMQLWKLHIAHNLQQFIHRNVEHGGRQIAILALFCQHQRTQRFGRSGPHQSTVGERLANQPVDLGAVTVHAPHFIIQVGFIGGFVVANAPRIAA